MDFLQKIIAEIIKLAGDALAYLQDEEQQRKDNIIRFTVVTNDKPDNDNSDKN